MKNPYLCPKGVSPSTLAPRQGIDANGQLEHDRGSAEKDKVMGRFTKILSIIGLAVIVIQAPVLAGVRPFHPVRPECMRHLQKAFKSPAMLDAEKILDAHFPDLRERPALVPVFEDPHVSVFRSPTTMRLPGQTRGESVFKVMPLSEALNDHHALHVLREVNASVSEPIEIIDTALLAPKSGGVTLATRVLQQSRAIEGRTLFDVLADPAVTPERKKALKGRYDSWVTEIKEFLDQQGYRGDWGAPDAFFSKNRGQSYADQPKMLFMKKPWLSLVEGDFIDLQYYSTLSDLSHGRVQDLLPFSEIEIRIKSDNFFVTGNDKLILFDPQ
jgi:hypothetical protein